MAEPLDPQTARADQRARGEVREEAPEGQDPLSEVVGDPEVGAPGAKPHAEQRDRGGAVAPRTLAAVENPYHAAVGEDQEVDPEDPVVADREADSPGRTPAVAEAQD